MRIPSDAARRRPRPMRRYQIGILVLVGVLIALVVIVQTLANIYTNYLWYRSLHLTMVWRSMMETRLGLAAVFFAVFFVACWLSLWVVDAVSPSALFFSPELEIVRRYQASIGRYRITVRTVVSAVLAFAVGVGTNAQWRTWILFEHAKSFGVKDAQFHRDVSFFVFRLPWISFLVSWSLVALILLLIVTAAAHYLNGGLRLAGPPPRIDPRAAAHLSLILALMALVKAAGYFFVDRYGLDLSNHGVVTGASYTDVHVRLPAMALLGAVSLVAFAILIFNLYQRGWILPVATVGLWVFVAIVVGAIYPAIVQWLHVNPSQSTVEQPYIARNIVATRAAFGLDNVQSQPFRAQQDLTANDVNANNQTLDALPLWDPLTARTTYDNLQALHGYYSVYGLATDRYPLGTGANRTLSPVVIGTREVLPSGEPRHSWVNTHLEYTHGYGMILAPANTPPGSSGKPTFDIGGTPAVSTGGAPKITQPAIYFGRGGPSYAIVDTKQSELNYQPSGGGKAQVGHYAGSGGIELSGFWQQFAYAVHFHDLNLLVSKLLTHQSRIIYNSDVVQRVQLAAPFLKVDANPYPVLSNGRIYWVVDCYTTTADYPYSQDASTSELSYSSGLQGTYNYVRNSVKAVVDAYTGQVRLFAVDAHDPILQSWESAYPGVIEPISHLAQLSPDLYNHLRFPQDLMMVLASMYGRYHLTAASTSTFYQGQDFWNLARSSGGGAFTPTYELLRLPGHTSLEFVAMEPLVPASATGKSQLLTSFLAASSSYRNYGQITAYTLNSEGSLAPALVNQTIQSNSSISTYITQHDQHGSTVLFGPTLLVPIEDSLLYVESLYVTGNRKSFPALRRVVAVLGNQSGIGSDLTTALRGVFGPTVSAIGPGQLLTIPEQVQSLLQQAYTASLRAQRDGKNFDLGALQKDVDAMNAFLKKAHELLGKTPTTGGSSPTTPSTTVPASSSTSTTSSTGTTAPPTA